MPRRRRPQLRRKRSRERRSVRRRKGEYPVSRIVFLEPEMCREKKIVVCNSEKKRE
jgi:hypothetical protein